MIPFPEKELELSASRTINIIETGSMAIVEGMAPYLVENSPTELKAKSTTGRERDALRTAIEQD